MKQLFIFTLILLIFLNAVTAANITTIGNDLVLSVVNQDPDPAPAGDVVELRIGVENRGQSAVDDLVVELVPTYPFSLATGESAINQIGTLRGYQVGSDLRIVRFKLLIDHQSLEGDYNLKIYTYKKGERDIARTEQTIAVSIRSRENAEVIYIDQVELLPGKITPLTFTINNVGSAPLRDLTFHWENADGIILPVGSDDTKYINYIDVGDSKDLVYNVIASGNAEPDLYRLDLDLTYDDPVTGEENTISTSAGVYVGGQTDFDVAFSGTANGESSFSISNIGSVSASSVTVRVPKQQGWSVSGSNSVIIGNLNEGDYTIASFAVSQAGLQTQSSSTQPSSTPSQTQTNPRTNQNPNRLTGNFTRPSQDLVIEIVYTDSRGERNTARKNVTVSQSTPAISTGTAGSGQFTGQGRFAQQQNSSNAKWWIIAGIILVLLAIFSHRRYKQGLLNDRNYSYTKMIKQLFGK